MRPEQLHEETLDRLGSVRGKLLVSIFIPTHEKGPEITQDPIRLKNHLAEVDDQLESSGLKVRERSQRLAEAHSLLDDLEFWEHQGTSLAVFIEDDGGTMPVSLPIPAEANTWVGPHFHLRPLLGALDAGALPVLVLTKGTVRLYESGRFEISVVDADLPASFDDVNWFIQREPQRQQHPDRAGGSTRNRHGHDPKAKETEDLHRYLRAVSSALPGTIEGRHIVLLGDERAVSAFEEITEQKVMIPPNFGVARTDDVDEIHARAMPVIDQVHRSAQESALERAGSALGKGKATTDLASALEAAAAGAVSELVLRADAEPIPGVFDPDSMKVTKEDRPGAGVEDLIDRLVIHARATGAAVTVIDAPDADHDFVAILRY